MKTSEEMAASVLDRRNHYQITRKRNFRIAASALCLVLVLGGVFWLSRTGRSSTRTSGSADHADGAVMSVSGFTASHTSSVTEVDFRTADETAAGAVETAEPSAGPVTGE